MKVSVPIPTYNRITALAATLTALTAQTFHDFHVIVADQGETPAAHCGEDVLAQLRLTEKYGGFGLIPSGAYHQELPATINDREVNAPVFLNDA